MTTNTRPSWPHTTSVDVRFRRPDGTEGSCIIADTTASTTIDYYATLGYVTIGADTFAVCSGCDGRGKRTHKRNHLRMVRCPDCLGEGQRTIA